MNSERSWVATVAYPGKEPFYFGNVLAPRGHSAYEVERTIEATIGKHMPLGFQVTQLQPGSLVLVEEAAERRAA
jgi:hypothetical protein